MGVYETLKTSFLYMFFHLLMIIDLREINLFRRITTCHERKIYRMWWILISKDCSLNELSRENVHQIINSQGFFRL